MEIGMIEGAGKVWNNQEQTIYINGQTRQVLAPYI